ncbi:MAG TPA: ribonuclease P protein component [Puia sp.]|nr:ribonuclease P protein component [Puia sp.]
MEIKIEDRINRRFTWNRKEKLKSRKRIERVFREGKSQSLFPFKVLWLVQSAQAASRLQAGFGVSSRHFKKAVDRNRIKRLSREAYRLQKHALLRLLEDKGLYLAVFFLYTGKDLPDYPTVTHKIGVLLQKLIKEIS